MFHFLRKLLSGAGRLRKRQLNYFITTAASSQDRVRRLGLPTPPPGGSAILNLSRLRDGVDVLSCVGRGDAGGMECAPDPYFEWIIDIDPGEGRYFMQDEVLRIFDQNWRRGFRTHVLYGQNLGDHKWTYVVAEEDWGRFGRVQVGVNLLAAARAGVAGVSAGAGVSANAGASASAGFSASAGVSASVVSDLEAEELDVFFAALKDRLKRRWRFGQAMISEPAEAAVLRALELAELRRELHQEVVIRLKSTDVYPGVGAYSGIRVWEVLTETGLQWGDGDLFHWMNDREELFSVWTSTEPGYFFPEAIKEGSFNPADLIFGYFIGRSEDPCGVFDILVEEVEHCRQQLGGEVLGGDGLPFDVDRERRRVGEMVERMIGKGLQPGSVRALRMFQ